MTDQKIIQRKRKPGLLTLLTTMKPLDEKFPVSDDLAPKPERITGGSVKRVRGLSVENWIA